MTQLEEVLMQAIQDLHRWYEVRIASLKIRIGALQALAVESPVQETSIGARPTLPSPARTRNSGGC